MSRDPAISIRYTADEAIALLPDDDQVRVGYCSGGHYNVGVAIWWRTKAEREIREASARYQAPSVWRRMGFGIELVRPALQNNVFIEVAPYTPG